jgi:hypothetical protein
LCEHAQHDNREWSQDSSHTCWSLRVLGLSCGGWSPGACRFSDFLAMHAEIHDTTVHVQLQHDLIEHLWRLKGEASTVLAPCSCPISIYLVCCLLTFNLETILSNIFICVVCVFK